MPDINKIRALQNAEFRLRLGCHFCIHSTLKPIRDWGTSGKISYQHEKHTGEARQASIHRSGYCAYFEENMIKITELEKSGFDIFLP